MQSEVFRIERSIRLRSETDKVLINYWLYIFLLSWITLGILGIVLYFNRIIRVDRFINRRQVYFEELLKFSELNAKQSGMYNELSMQFDRLRNVYDNEFIKKNKKINAGLSFFLILITLGMWHLVVQYKLNKAWNNLQLAEAKYYDELNPILIRLGFIKYPISFKLKHEKKRSFFLNIILTILTLGIWTFVWGYKIHTDPDNLYPEFHQAEDVILNMVRNT